MMTRKEFDQLLDRLALSQLEAARLLSVDARTVRRWAENPAEMPGPAARALSAWFALQRVGLPWSPDSVDLVEMDPDQIAKHRVHAIELDSLLKKVALRGGPAAPWLVDLDKCRATLGPLEVSFYCLHNGGFSPQSYRRKDGPADLQRDWSLIEDAFAHIAHEIGRQRKKKKTK